MNGAGHEQIIILKIFIEPISTLARTMDPLNYYLWAKSILVYFQQGKHGLEAISIRLLSHQIKTDCLNGREQLKTWGQWHGVEKCYTNFHGNCPFSNKLKRIRFTRELGRSYLQEGKGIPCNQSIIHHLVEGKTVAWISCLPQKCTMGHRGWR